MIDLQARDITEEQLLKMFPHLPIEQALAMANNPEGLFNLWMTHAGNAWLQEINDRKAEEARQASYEAWREGELADAILSGETTHQAPTDNQKSYWDDFVWNHWLEIADATDYGLTKNAIQFTSQGNYTSLSIHRASLPLYRQTPLFPQSLTTIRQQLGYPGTRYLNSNIPLMQTPGAIFRSNTGMKTGLIAIITGTVKNIYDFTLGNQVGGDGSDFLASTLVDIGINAAIGVATAATLALLGTIFVPLAAVGIPAVAAGLFIGIGIGFLVDYNFSDQIDALKKDVSEGLDDWGEIFSTAGEVLRNSTNSAEMDSATAESEEEDQHSTPSNDK